MDSEQTGNFENEPEVILIGFKYDTATEITFPWITEDSFLASHPKEKLHRFHKGTAEEQSELAAFLVSDKLEDSRTVEIFCGHGIVNALLGPPRQAGRKHHPYYDLDMISSFPSSMFAFCCYSAKIFGLEYCSSQDKFFLGFTEKIPLPLDVASEIKSIFQEVAEDIVKTGKITQDHETQFRNLISNLMKDIMDGKIKCDAPTIVLDCLNQYKSCLKRI